ncbi:MAG: heme-binding protein [Xanthobacteraceae bacterium]
MGNSNIKGETSMRRFALTLCAICAALLIHSHVFAQQPAAPPPPPAYGPPISLEMAKKAMAAAEAEAVKNNWDMVITILDSGGNLVMTHKMDNAPLGSIASPEARRELLSNLNAHPRQSKMASQQAVRDCDY